MQVWPHAQRAHTHKRAQIQMRIWGQSKDKNKAENEYLSLLEADKWP